MLGFLKKIDWYILSRMLMTFAFTLAMFNLIGVVIDYVEHIDDFIKRKAPNKEVVLFYLNFFPWVSALLAHLFLFISVIFFTSKLAYQSEIIAIQASGVSFNRLLRPYIVGAFLIFLVMLFANHILVPLTNKTRFRIQDKYLFIPNEQTKENRHLRISPTEYLYTQSYNKGQNRASRLTFEKFDKDFNLIKKVNSLTASYDSVHHKWDMNNVSITTFDGKLEHTEYLDKYSYDWKINPDNFFEETRPKEELTTYELKDRIAKAKILGLDTNNFLFVELYRRTANAFAIFFFVIIGVCLASVKVRGGSGIHLAIGIIMSAIFIFIQQFTYTLSTKGNTSPMLAVWIPNFILMIAAYMFYRKRMKI